MTDDLAAFVRARVDADEAEALAASPGPWHVTAEQDEVLAVDGERVADGFALSGRQLRATTRHIARHDPARVLRDVAAKRRLLAVHRPYVVEPDQACLGCAGDNVWERCPVLRALAAVYDDHPDYREEWRPVG